MRRGVALAVAGALAALAALASGCAGQGSATDDGNRPRTLRILGAASLAEAFPVLGEVYESRHRNVRVRFGFGGSSELAAQVRNGAPADVLAAASPETMGLVVEAGEAATEPVVFARNRLALVVAADNPGGVRGLADLARRDLVVALCAPEVPCGASAAAALEASGVKADVDTYESDVKAALSKVLFGEVDAALVFRTDVLAAGDRVQDIPLPKQAQVSNDYLVSVLRASDNRKLAKGFVDLLRSEEGRKVLVSAGFEAP